MTTDETLHQFQPETRDENWIRQAADITEPGFIAETTDSVFDEEQPAPYFCPLNEW